MTRDQCLDAARKMEAAKLQAQIDMHAELRAKRMHPDKVPLYVKVSHLKATDALFNEAGVEAEDLYPSVKRLNLKEDDEFKAIQAESKQKIEEFRNSLRPAAADGQAAAAQ